MENTSQEKVVQAKEPKQKSPLTGLLLGVTTFLFLTLIGVLLFLFTGLGSMLVSRVENAEEIEVVEQVEEEDKEVVALENEGWALYSIPEYGFSVEIPDTTEYNEGFDQYMRWETSRSKLNQYSPDSLEQININYYPSGFSPQAAGCGQGCNGEIQIEINYYDKDTQYDLESMQAKKRDEIDNWNETWEQDEGYKEKTIDDYIEESVPFGEGVWCVNMPAIADGNYRECYFEKEEYLVEVIHTGLDLTDFGIDVRSSELYNILDSMKFE